MCLAVSASGKSGDKRGTIKETQAGVGISGRLTGRVLKSDNNNIIVEYQGVAVPLRVTRRTLFSGDGVKAPTDVMEGQQVRAGFELDVDLAQNRLTSLQVLDGEGEPGQGSSVTPNPSCPRQPDSN
jgi:hypothetical protein